MKLCPMRQRWEVETLERGSKNWALNFCNTSILALGYLHESMTFQVFHCSRLS